MKSLSSQLTARLAAWRTSPWPIHRFLRVNFSHTTTPQWRTWTTYPDDITVDGFDYTRDNRLASVGTTEISESIGRQGFSFAVYDDDGFIESTASSGIYRGYFVRCDVHFAGTPAHIRSLLYRDVLYEGALDAIAISRNDSGKFLATLTAASPFASLDTMRGRQGSKEDQRAIAPNDSSMDEALKSANDSDLKWGQSI